MPDRDPTQITQRLKDIAGGQSAAADELLQCVYEQLHKIAQRRMAGERPGHTLQATALVHEAYLRLMGEQEVAWCNRAQFLSCRGRSHAADSG